MRIIWGGNTSNELFALSSRKLSCIAKKRLFGRAQGGLLVEEVYRSKNPQEPVTAKKLGYNIEKTNTALLEKEEVEMGWHLTKRESKPSRVKRASLLIFSSHTTRARSVLDWILFNILVCHLLIWLAKGFHIALPGGHTMPVTDQSWGSLCIGWVTSSFVLFGYNRPLQGSFKPPSMLEYTAAGLGCWRSVSSYPRGTRLLPRS